MDPLKPGYKSTEGILSALAVVFSGLVALKWVPINVSVTLQADAVKAIPAIVTLYTIGRSAVKAVASIKTPVRGVLLTQDPTSADTVPVEADSHPGL